MPEAFTLILCDTAHFCINRYISTGSGQGNPYGLAAVIGVCAPFFFFWRLYWPVPPMTNIILFVTTGLVLGFSWQNTHTTLPFRFMGWQLAWVSL